MEVTAFTFVGLDSSDPETPEIRPKALNVSIVTQEVIAVALQIHVMKDAIRQQKVENATAPLANTFQAGPIFYMKAGFLNKSHLTTNYILSMDFRCAQTQQLRSQNSFFQTPPVQGTCLPPSRNQKPPSRLDATCCGRQVGSCAKAVRHWPLEPGQRHGRSGVDTEVTAFRWR